MPDAPGLILAALLSVTPVAAQTQESGESLWNGLLEGNRQFVAGRLTYGSIVQQRKDWAEKQNPRTTVLSCADSRVPPELIFNRSIGDLFVLRTAGNVADPFEIASMEYAIDRPDPWTRLIVVMGHSRCGAVAAALNPGDPPTPSLLALVQRIRGSFAGVGYAVSPDPDLMRRATDANARAVAAHLLAHSPVIRKAVLERRLTIVLAYYDLATGQVSELRPLPVIP